MIIKPALFDLLCESFTQGMKYNYIIHYPGIYESLQCSVNVRWVWVFALNSFIFWLKGVDLSDIPYIWWKLCQCSLFNIYPTTTLIPKSGWWYLVNEKSYKRFSKRSEFWGHFRYLQKHRFFYFRITFQIFWTTFQFFGTTEISSIFLILF